MLKMKVTEYAKSRNLSTVYIYRLIKQGTIPSGAVSKQAGTIFLDTQKTDDALLQNNVKMTPIPKKVETTITAGTSGLTYADAKMLSEKYKAALLKIELDTQTGKLVSAEEVKRTAFTTGRQLRDALLAIPDRVAPMITADPEKAADILTKEISQALEVLSV